MKLSEKIANLRKQNGLSQEDLAEKLDISRQSVSRWESGSAMPDASNLIQLSTLFDVTTDYLLNDDYVSDNDIPKVKEITENNTKTLLYFLLVLEILNFIMQFMCVVILENIFFSILSFVPFICLIAAFEYSYIKKGYENKTVKLFRRKFYFISAWIGLYFPVRLMINIITSLLLIKWISITFLVRECITLAVYICLVGLVNLSIEKQYITKK